MTLLKVFEVPDVLEVQDIPSDDVKIVPVSPIVTNKSYPKVTPFSELDVPELLEVHEVPSDEV